MQTPPSPTRWHAHAGAVLLAVAILGALAAGVAGSGALRALLGEAWAQMRVGPVLAVLPVQAVAIGLCAVALWRLGPGVSWAACLESRLLRDAGNNMLIFLPGLGEVIGTRVMVLAGGRPRVAVTVRGLDVLAETLAQIPYVAVALVLLRLVWRRVGLPVPSVPGWDWLVAAVLIVAGLWLAWRWAKRSSARPVRRLRAEARLLLREAGRRRRAMPVAIGLHIIGWGLSGAQIWIAARMFGLPLSLGGAIAIESAASAVRVLLFFVPGGLVSQEAGIVAAGLVFGLAPPASLALALVLRIRDVIFGAALAWWPVLEWRAKRDQQADHRARGL